MTGRNRSLNRAVTERTHEEKTVTADKPADTKAERINQIKSYDPDKREEELILEFEFTLNEINVNKKNPLKALRKFAELFEMEVTCQKDKDDKETWFEEKIFLNGVLIAETRQGEIHKAHDIVMEIAVNQHLVKNNYSLLLEADNSTERLNGCHAGGPFQMIRSGKIKEEQLEEQKNIEQEKKQKPTLSFWESTIKSLFGSRKVPPEVNPSNPDVVIKSTNPTRGMSPSRQDT